MKNVLLGLALTSSLVLGACANDTADEPANNTQDNVETPANDSTTDDTDTSTDDTGSADDTGSTDDTESTQAVNTAEDAIGIALADVGLREQDVMDLEVELDDDDAEVEFHADGIEYEYKIDRATGEIRELDLEMDQ